MQAILYIHSTKLKALSNAFLKADVDGNGLLSCDEFVTMSVHLKRIGNDDILSQAFRFFDKNQSGFIEVDELKEVLLDDNAGPKGDQTIRDILRDVDLDRVILFSFLFSPLFCLI